MTGVVRPVLEDEEARRDTIARRLQRDRVWLSISEALIAAAVLAVVLVEDVYLFWAVAGVLVLGSGPVIVAVVRPWHGR